MAEIKLAGRKIKGFRCHIDPSIPPKPMNAIPCDTGAYEAEMVPMGIWVRYAKTGQEFIVPYPNVQRIELLPEETKK